jgi:hypothetical protein
MAVAAQRNIQRATRRRYHAPGPTAPCLPSTTGVDGIETYVNVNVPVPVPDLDPTMLCT